MFKRGDVIKPKNDVNTENVFILGEDSFVEYGKVCVRLDRGVVDSADNYTNILEENQNVITPKNQ